MDKERYRVTLGVFAAIFDEKDRVLLVKHAYGKRGWSLIGGAVDKPPKHQHSWTRLKYELKREIIEEVGINVKLCPLVLSTLSPDSDDHRDLFLGTVDDGVAIYIAHPLEISKAGWFFVNNLPKDLYFPQEIYIKEAYELWPKVAHLVDP